MRFMPDRLGTWRYVTVSNHAGLNEIEGEFVCGAPGPGNHGPVQVSNTYHFRYADGTPYVPVGTTCYAWTHQGDALEERTLETLGTAPFNKMRMCVFPKHYVFNQNEPPHHAFERTPSGEWDHTRFDPAFFQHLEQRIGELCELGIEADLMRSKRMADWDRFFRVVQESDPSQHLRSIHNCRQFYDHGKPWVSHCSIQRHDLDQVTEWRELYRKPVVVDECGYEGDIERRWGNLTPQEMVNRFWEGTARPTCTRRTCCGGQRGACCAARARPGSASCGRSWRRGRRSRSTRCTRTGRSRASG